MILINTLNALATLWASYFVVTSFYHGAHKKKLGQMKFGFKNREIKINITTLPAYIFFVLLIIFNIYRLFNLHN